ncbi:MAG: 23S rRNA (pseudouridine(1915)-N(3))-methyltransferase RlmH [Pseudomonadota bacterium]
MRVTICAVGRMRSGPASTICEDYQSRFDRAGRGLALGPAVVAEVDDRRGGGIAAEAELLRKTVPKGALTCALDERGRTMPSTEFAATLARWRDDGHRDLAILIGGADGLDPKLRESADFSLSFGAMVWPHMLARVMLCEQLYRAVTILSGSPYHRA